MSSKKEKKKIIGLAVPIVLEGVVHMTRLQLVQNTAARLLTGTKRRDHITPVLAFLDWFQTGPNLWFFYLFLKLIMG